jgi:hypothetical protein
LRRSFVQEIGWKGTAPLVERTGCPSRNAPSEAAFAPKSGDTQENEVLRLRRQALGSAMFENLWANIRGYYLFYVQYCSNQWNHMNPIKYGTLLIGVGIFGWILMKTANKRT